MMVVETVPSGSRDGCPANDVGGMSHSVAVGSHRPSHNQALPSPLILWAPYIPLISINFCFFAITNVLTDVDFSLKVGIHFHANFNWNTIPPSTNPSTLCLSETSRTIWIMGYQNDPWKGSSSFWISGCKFCVDDFQDMWVYDLVWSSLLPLMLIMPWTEVIQDQSWIFQSISCKEKEHFCYL